MSDTNKTAWYPMRARPILYYCYSFLSLYIQRPKVDKENRRKQIWKFVAENISMENQIFDAILTK